MKAEFKYIDAGGQLYRGFGRQWPVLIWQAEHARWASCGLATPQEWDWGELVTPREAERCYPGSTGAPLPDGIESELDVSVEDMMRYRPELFDEYDFGTMPRRSPEEIAEGVAHIEQMLSADTAARPAKRRAE